METGVVWRSFAVGVTSGLRSMTGPAVARWRVHDPLRLTFAALAVGELIADKLPSTPARTTPPALIVRALSGAYAGRTVAAAFDADLTAGMVAGAAGALAGAYAGMALRGEIVRGTGLPDPLVAVVEDVLAVYGALAATHP